MPVIQTKVAGILDDLGSLEWRGKRRKFRVSQKTCALFPIGGIYN